MGHILKKKYATWLVWSGVSLIAILHFMMFVATSTMTLSQMHTHAIITLFALGALTFGGSQMGGK